MAESELYVSGIGISKRVISTVVSLAAKRVEGVASVGGNDITSSLINVFTSNSVAPESAVESSVEDGGPAHLRASRRLLRLPVHQARG